MATFAFKFSLKQGIKCAVNCFRLQTQDHSCILMTEKFNSRLPAQSCFLHFSMAHWHELQLAACRRMRSKHKYFSLRCVPPAVVGSAHLLAQYTVTQIARNTESVPFDLFAFGDVMKTAGKCGFANRA